MWRGAANATRGWRNYWVLRASDAEKGQLAESCWRRRDGIAIYSSSDRFRCSSSAGFLFTYLTRRLRCGLWL